MKQYIKLIFFRHTYVYTLEQKSKWNFQKFQQNYSLTLTSEHTSVHFTFRFITIFYNNNKLHFSHYTCKHILTHSVQT